MAAVAVIPGRRKLLLSAGGDGRIAGRHADRDQCRQAGMECAKATICMIHGPEDDSGAVARITARRARHLIFRNITIRLCDHSRAESVTRAARQGLNRLAPKIRSVGLVVVADPLLLLVLLPEPATAMSTGLLRSAPLYSKIRTSGRRRSRRERTVTEFSACGSSRDVLGVIDRLCGISRLNCRSDGPGIGITFRIGHAGNGRCAVVPSHRNHI